MKRKWIIFAMLLIIPAVLFSASCAKKAVMTEPSVTDTSAADEAARQAEMEKQKADSDRNLVLFLISPLSAINNAAESAPAPAALKRNPYPLGPACNTSTAKIGRKVIYGIPMRLNMNMRDIIL